MSHSECTNVKFPILIQVEYHFQIFSYNTKQKGTLRSEIIFLLYCYSLTCHTVGGWTESKVYEFSETKSYLIIL